MSAETWDWLRWVNAAIASLVVLLLTAEVSRRWPTLHPRLRHASPWMIGTYVVIAYGSVEVASLENPVDPGFRVMLLAINLAGLAVALAINMGDHGE